MCLSQKFELNVSKNRENLMFPNLVSEPWLSGLEARASRSGAPATLSLSSGRTFSIGYVWAFVWFIAQTSDIPQNFVYDIYLSIS